MAQRILLICLSIASLQLTGCSRLFFYPQQTLLRDPADIGVKYENVHFSSTDCVKLHGWFMPAKRRPKGTVVFFHGNAENISSHVGAVYWLPEQDFNVFIFDYRGFGLSQGKADVKGVHRDAQAALQYVVSRNDVDPNKLVLFGQSVGGAIALYTAVTTDVSIRAVIAESAFSSYPVIMREKMSEVLLTWPLQWMAIGMTSKYDPISVIDEIAPTPVLLIHGDQDKIIPVEHAHKLYAKAQGDKQLWIIEDAGHIGAFAPNRMDYRQRFTQYLEEVVKD